MMGIRLYSISDLHSAIFHVAPSLIMIILLLLLLPLLMPSFLLFFALPLHHVIAHALVIPFINLSILFIFVPIRSAILFALKVSLAPARLAHIVLVELLFVVVVAYLFVMLDTGQLYFEGLLVRGSAVVVVVVFIGFIVIAMGMGMVVGVVVSVGVV